MRTGTPQFALLVLFYFQLAPLQACQPTPMSNYVLELEDGVHVFVMQGYETKVSEYPVSGVYRKGPDKQLLWEYHGTYLESWILKNRISANGRYLVEAHYPRKGQAIYLSIYDNGSLIGEFHRDTFVDDPSQVYQPPCDSPYWAVINYDKQNERAIIESIAGRVVTIYVPAAEISSVDNVQLMRIDGEITYHNGSKSVIRKIGRCSKGLSMTHLRKQDGLTDTPVFIAYENGKYSTIEGNRYFIPDVFDVYLEQVRSMVFGELDENGDYPVEMQLTDGAFHHWHVFPHFTLCGLGREGKNLELKLNEIKSLIITLARPEV